MSVFLRYSVENAQEILAKMGHISSKTAASGESQNNSFDESPYLGPSGLNLGLQNPSISVSQGLCQLQVRNDYTEVRTR